MLDFLEKVILNTVGPAVSLVLAALIGQRISAKWAERQKKREHELALVNTFYSSYGEFCAIWKDWNHTLMEGESSPDELKTRRQELRERACRAEGALESVLLKIAAERILTQHERVDLGNLRQAYQVLRERIEERVRISYGASDHPDYLEFKRLATLLGVMLAQHSVREPSAIEAFESFREITDNRPESRWKRMGRSRS
ncbi:hypothetical protein [Candidatus Electronema sp. JM]|uniref:hypothetical protein n=1 Tax=Candidatus Electronema sp. JM TaxID=3401571 RepID=UPI003AA9726C